ncbi:hypothetical protein BGX24_011541 [Mortierella sp. AD032]|nr:hypothetical protein BGX24_011541 [Mortierella sp. AD032]
MRSTFTIASTPLVVGLLVLSTFARADKVYLTMPKNNTNAIAGCDMDLGFRVQYSDLAMLQWVQIQILNADQTIVVDKLDNSTRTEWDDVRAKNITWSVPGDLAPGDYIVRAFGDAVYYCTEKGIHTLCPLPLEDRETIHVTAPLKAGNDPLSPSSTPDCPASLTPFSKPNTSSASSLSSSSPSPPSPASPSTSAPPALHFSIDSNVLNLLQSGDHTEKQQAQEQEKQQQQEQKATNHTEGGNSTSSTDTGKGFSQNTGTASGSGRKEEGGSFAVNGAAGIGIGSDRWTVAGRVGSGTSLAVLMVVTLLLL